MKIIYYNSAVAKHCGRNGIPKAVLLNYIYNYHRPNPRKGAGSPARILLREFIYQYTHSVGPDEETSLWKKSFIHKILKDLEDEHHLSTTREKNLQVYSVSRAIAGMLANKDATLVSFDLGMACENGIHIAIMSRYLLHVIDCSKKTKGEAYNLSVKEMAEINQISSAQIYRAINALVKMEILRRVKSPLKFRSRALSLARY